MCIVETSMFLYGLYLLAYGAEIGDDNVSGREIRPVALCYLAPVPVAIGVGLPLSLFGASSVFLWVVEGFIVVVASMAAKSAWDDLRHQRVLADL